MSLVLFLFEKLLICYHSALCKSPDARNGQSPFASPNMIPVAVLPTIEWGRGWRWDPNIFFSVRWFVVASFGLRIACDLLLGRQARLRDFRVVAHRALLVDIGIDLLHRTAIGTDRKCVVEGKV